LTIIQNEVADPCLLQNREYAVCFEEIFQFLQYLTTYFEKKKILPKICRSLGIIFLSQADENSKRGISSLKKGIIFLFQISYTVKK